jgi:adenylate cyclase
MKLMRNPLSAYLPQDRYRALLNGNPLPEVTQGTALFADISGFTSMTEKMSVKLGARRGIEEFTNRINTVYQHLIAEIERFNGSVINFAGDSITCWFDEKDGQLPQRAVACAQAMQQVMASFENLAVKISITTGKVHRRVVGNPDINLLDTLSGATVVRLAAGEHLAASFLWKKPSPWRFPSRRTVSRMQLVFPLDFHRDSC